ncbi:MAG TPA: hypothetical protein DCE78_10365 [Bacteroidetes bacterium]|nr:hypothetical protein [Bacteroidota bacterium]
MKTLKNKVLPVFLIIVCVFVALDSAQAQQKPPNWWMINSLKLDSLPPGTHFHAEGDYTFYHSTGNVDMTMHKGAPKIFVRNGRLLFEFLGAINFQKMQVQEGPVTRHHSNSANLKMIYDITPAFQSETGILRESDDSQYLDHRTVYYTGLIYNNMGHKTLGKLFFIAAGYQTLRSTELPAGLPIDEQEKFIIYAQQTYVVKVIPRVQLTESLTFIQELDDHKSYRTDFQLKAQYMLSPRVSGLVAYQAKYEKEPLIPELALFTTRMNTSITIGVRVNI